MKINTLPMSTTGDLGLKKNAMMEEAISSAELSKENILKCPKCSLPFYAVWDEDLNEVSKYIFEPTCNHYPKSVRISIG